MDKLIKFAIVLVILASAGGVGGYSYSIGAAVNTATGIGAAFGGIALLLFECSLAPMGGRALGKREYVAGLAYFLLLFIFVLPVVTSLDFGFTSSLFSSARARAAVSAFDVSAVPKRSAGEVQAEIDGLLLDPALGNCLVQDGPKTKARCPRVAELRQELAAAKAFEGKTAGGVVVGEADPRASMLARRTGYSADGIADVLNVMTALALAFARVAGCYYLFGHNTPVTAQAEAPAAEKSPKPVLVSVEGVTRHPVVASLETLGARKGEWHGITQRALASALGVPLSRANAALRDAETAGAVSVRTGAGGTQVRVA